jgi:glycosyltransferase involved in cell wall biosynthesis
MRPNHSAARRPRIAVVLKGYPRLSETFIAQEIRALELRGFDLELVSLRRPTDRLRHPVHDEIQAPVRYLPEYLHEEPLRVLRAWWAVRRRPGYHAARRRFLADLRRDPTRNRVRRFGQALTLAAELATGVVHLHAHFMHTPASVARYAAHVLGLGFSISAHAKDIWTSPDWEKREKLAEARFVVTCTRHNAEHLDALVPGRVDLVYHGLDLSRFPAPPRQAVAQHDRSCEDAAVELVSVGRAVEKKGYAVLLEALARLPRALHWHLHHVGSGPLLPSLQAQARKLGIDDRVSWHGAQAQATVVEHYRRADAFVLASLIARDGDRDGLPNVLMEAQSQGVPCVASAVSAVPELIDDGDTGVLVPPGDAAALARALESVIRDPGYRRRLGEAGERRLRAAFSMHDNIELLVRRLGSVSPPAVGPGE